VHVRLVRGRPDVGRPPGSPAIKLAVGILLVVFGAAMLALGARVPLPG
jgi:hypothetical protein